MAVKTPNTQEEQDAAYNPGELHAREQFDNYASAGTDQAEAFANDPANATKEKEEDPNTLNYTGAQNSDTASSGGRFSKVRGVFGRKSASIGIIGILVAAFGGMSVLFAPGLAVVHLKEVFTEDLNDAVTAMDLRSVHVYRAKLKDLGKKGICTGVKIRCGLRGMTDKQLRAFSRAGVDIDVGDKNPVTRKTSVRAMTFTKSDGTKVTITNPSQLNRHLGDRSIRNQLRRAYNPKFYSAWDKTFGKVLTKWKTSRADKLKGNTPEEMDESMKSATAGDQVDLERQAGTSDPGEDGTQEDINNHNSESGHISDTESATHGGVGGVGHVFGGAVKGVGILGALDSACTVYNTSRAIEAGAKIIRARQLIQFSMVFLTFADQVKAGEATEQQAEYVGDKLTAIDTREFVVNETSKNKDEQVKNPYFEKSAFDSEGAKAAFYNDAPTLTAQSQQFTVGGGGTLGTLSAINGKITGILGGNPAGKCKLVQNPFVRGGSAIVGVVAGFFSGGATLAWSVGSSLAISLALPILESYLKDMIAGETVSPNTKGVDAGNAIFSGTGALLGSGAQARGMKPANKSDLETYLAKNKQVQDEYIAMGVEDAKSTPFDIMNQYSFAGMFARRMLPSYLRSSSSTAAFVASPLSMASTAISSITPSAKAVGDFNPERFSKCNDRGYSELGIDADVFCNVRYTMSSKELSMDTEEVYMYMFESGQIDEDHNVVSGSDYEKFLENCVNRPSGWGDVDPDAENSSTGADCMGDDDKLSSFRVYTMDRSIEEGMDNGPTESAQSSVNSGNGATLRVASYNILGKHHTDGPKANSNLPTWTERIVKVVDNVKSNQIDVIGMQESEPDQVNYLKSHLSGYEVSSKGKDGDTIMWNGAKFTKTADGTWESTYFGREPSGIKIDEPWVKLRDNSTGQEFYIMNVHDPINDKGTNAQTRYNNALKHVVKINELKTQAPIIFTGDFNNGYRKDDGSGMPSDEKTTYCVFSNNGMTDAIDALKDQEPKCSGDPRPDKGADIDSNIDHIYVSEGLDVTKYFDINKPQSGSDHVAVVADVLIPGAEDGSATVSGDLAWPVDRKYWDSNPGEFKQGHNDCGSFTGGGCIDIGAPVPKGAPVYAIAGGKVTKRPLGRESTKCTGNPNVDNNGGLMIESQVDGKTLRVAYAHGYDVISGSTVTTGQKIMSLGEVGNACGPHLHIDMTWDGKAICPQDVFIAMGASRKPNFTELTTKQIGTCAR
jgi:endonuclease/exonuclease/phosphatase family metal-dependent hydrolase